MACCKRLAVSYYFAFSPREIVDKPFIYVITDVRFEYSVNELVSGHRVDGLTKVYCCKKCSISRRC